MGALEEDHVESAQVEALEQKQDHSGVEATHSDDHDAKGMEKEEFHVTSASTVSGDEISSLEVNVKGDNLEQTGDTTDSSDAVLGVPDSSGLEFSESENSSADVPPVAAESVSVAKETGSVDSIVEVEEAAPETQQAEADLVKEDIDGVSWKEEAPKNTEEVDEDFNVVKEDIDVGSLVQEVQDGASYELGEEAEKVEPVNEVGSGISSADADETAEVLEGDKEELRVAEEDVEGEVTAAPENAADSSEEVKLRQEEEESSSALVTGDEAEHAVDAVTEADVATEAEALEVEEEAKVTAEDETKVPDSTLELPAGEEYSVTDAIEATQLAEGDATQEDTKMTDEESAGIDSEVLEKEASKDLESVAETGKGTEDAEQDEGAEATTAMEETKLENPDHGTGEAVVSEGDNDGLVTDETVAEVTLSEEANEAAEADKESQVVLAADEAVAVPTTKEEEEDDSKAVEETGKDTEDEHIDISSEAMDDSRDVGTTGLNAEQEGDREVLDQTAAREENPEVDGDNLDSENRIEEVIPGLEGMEADEAKAVENAEDIGQTVTEKAILETENKAEEAVDTDNVTGSGEDVDGQTVESAEEEIPSSVEETTTQNVAGEVATNEEAASDAPEIISKAEEQVDIVSAALISPDAGDVEEKNIAAQNVEDMNADEGAAANLVREVTDSNVNEALETESSIPDAEEIVEEAGEATEDGEDVAVGSSEHAQVEATHDSEDVTREVSADTIDIQVPASSFEQDEGAEAIPTEEMQVENVGDGTGESVVSEGLVTDKVTTPDEAGTVGEELETNPSIEDGVANIEEPEAAVSSALPAETDGDEVPRDVSETEPVQIDEGKTEATTLIEAPGEDEAAVTDDSGEIDAAEAVQEAEDESPEALNSVEDATTTEADHVESLTAEGEDGSVEAAEVDATVLPDETTEQGDASAEDSSHTRDFVVDQAKQETEEQAEANNEDNSPEAEASIGSPGLEDNSEIEQAEAAGLENNLTEQAEAIAEESSPEAEASTEDSTPELKDNNTTEQAEEDDNNGTEQAETITEDSSNLTEQAEASTENVSTGLEDSNVTGDLEVEATMDEDHKSSEEAIEQSNEDDKITRDFVADQVFEAEEASPGDQKLSEEDEVEEAEKSEEGLTRGDEAKEDDSQSVSIEQAGDSPTDENAKEESSPVTVEKTGEDETVSEEAPAADERRIMEDNVVEQTDEAAKDVCVTEPAAAKTEEIRGEAERTVPSQVTEEAEVDHDPSLSKDEGGRTRIASAFDSMVNAAMHLAKATKPSKKKRLRLKKELKKQLFAA